MPKGSIEGYNKEKKEIQIFISPFDEDGLTKGRPKKILSSKLSYTKGDAIVESVARSFKVDVSIGLTNDNLAIKVSRDSSKIMISGIENFNHSKGKQIIWVKVFDIDFNQIWEKEIQTDHENKKEFIQEYDVNNDGHVVVASKHYRKGKRKEIFGLSNWEYDLYLIKKDTMLSLPLKLQGENSIVNLRMIFNNKNMPILSGSYKNRSSKEGRVNGTFLIEINSEKMTTIIEKIHPFEQEYMNEFPSKKKNKKDENGILSLALGNFIELENGSYVLTGEEYYFGDRSYGGLSSGDENNEDMIRFMTGSSNNHNQVKHYYHTNNIMVTCFSNKGDQRWIRKIYSAPPLIVHFEYLKKMIN